MTARALLDVHLLIRRGPECLFIRRANTGFMDGRYSLVGGRVERGETLLGAAIREAEEEVGLAVDAADLRLVHVVQKFSAEDRVSFVFEHALRAGLEPVNREPDRCSGLIWARADAPPTPLVPYIAQVLAAADDRPACSAFTET